jgi:hypothetical protein
VFLFYFLNHQSLYLRPRFVIQTETLDGNQHTQLQQQKPIYQLYFYSGFAEIHFEMHKFFFLSTKFIRKLRFSLEQKLNRKSEMKLKERCKIINRMLKKKNGFLCGDLNSRHQRHSCSNP